VAVVPNGVDLDYFSPSDEAREPRTIVITGKMSYHANVTAVIRFVSDIMPKVWSEIPQARLWVVGRNPAPEIRKQVHKTDTAYSGGNGQPRIRVTGTVEDIRPYLRQATVAVAPIRYGVGIQNKVLEAMACGTPVVATREAVGDIRAHPGQDLMVAENGQELAHFILALLKNRELGLSIGRSGRAFAETHHNWRGIVQELTRIYANAIS
jgi:glycosyltransferase involved in cell wall biosynthesis